MRKIARLLTFFFLAGNALVTLGYGQVKNNIKKVAVLMPIDRQGNVDYFLKVMVKGKLTNAVTNISEFEAYDRTDIDAIFEEQAFQRTGHVSDEQKQKMGEIKGVDYVLVSEVAQSGDNIYILAKLMSVETAYVEHSIDQLCTLNPEQMAEGCRELAKKLFNVSGTSTSGNISSSASRMPLTDGQDYVENTWGLNMKMVWVEGGLFIMGCTDEQGGDCDDDEKNICSVTLTGYYIGMTEVTQAQWQKVMGTSVEQQRDKEGNYRLAGVGGDYPMYDVNWDEAMAFCEELSRQTGRKYTLPTEAQWEYAARGGSRNDGTKYSGGLSIDAVAWYTGNSGNSSHMVGTKRPNGLGLYDMSGNVEEWCMDWYADSYECFQIVNHRGSTSGSERVSRGGSWCGNAQSCRVSYRSNGTSDSRYNNVGFRVVMIP
ncbi:MAG: SUMF1/EgtB/PvdO family nonheme iron enzyme [Bacteroides sp.]|nr:SUMF1/EgtB/PvdO family nonheme iron enzyme [Bacteroides sp.]